MTRSMPAFFSIGGLAQRAEVAVDTIRYYEREGLLPSPRRRPSGYREYDDSAVERVRFIRRAKTLGFTLDEIRELLLREADRDHGVGAIRQQAQARLAELDRRIAELMATRHRLAALVEACPGEGAPEDCPILGSIHDDTTHPANTGTPCCTPAPR